MVKKKNEISILCSKLCIKQEDEFAKEYYRMWENMYEYFKDKIVTYDEMNKFIEKEITILKKYKISAEELLQTLYEEKTRIVEINQEAVEMINYFNRKGIKSISITDWFVKHQEQVLEKFNILSYIEKIYGCDNTYLKNSTKKILQITQELKLEEKAEEFIIIGDSLSADIFFANQLGIKSIWYNRKEKNSIGNYVPTLEVKSLLEVKNIL